MIAKNNNETLDSKKQDQIGSAKKTSASKQPEFESLETNAKVAPQSVTTAHKKLRKEYGLKDDGAKAETDSPDQITTNTLLAEVKEIHTQYNLAVNIYYIIVIAISMIALLISGLGVMLVTAIILLSLGVAGLITIAYLSKSQSEKEALDLLRQKQEDMRLTPEDKQYIDQIKNEEVVEWNGYQIIITPKGVFIVLPGGKLQKMKDLNDVKDFIANQGQVISKVGERKGLRATFLSRMGLGGKEAQEGEAGTEARAGIGAKKGLFRNKSLQKGRSREMTPEEMKAQRKKETEGQREAREAGREAKEKEGASAEFPEGETSIEGKAGAKTRAMEEAEARAREQSEGKSGAELEAGAKATAEAQARAEAEAQSKTLEAGQGLEAEKPSLGKRMMIALGLAEDDNPKNPDLAHCPNGVCSEDKKKDMEQERTEQNRERQQEEKQAEKERTEEREKAREKAQEKEKEEAREQAREQTHERTQGGEGMDGGTYGETSSGTTGEKRTRSKEQGAGEEREVSEGQNPERERTSEGSGASEEKKKGKSAGEEPAVAETVAPTGSEVGAGTGGQNVEPIRTEHGQTTEPTAEEPERQHRMSETLEEEERQYRMSEDLESLETLNENRDLPVRTSGPVASPSREGE